jgi:hypothetical protein
MSLAAATAALWLSRLLVLCQTAWTAIAYLAFLEFSRTDVGLSVKGWVALTWSITGTALVPGGFLVILATLPRPPASASARTNVPPKPVNEHDAARWGAERVHWGAFVLQTGLVASLFAQFASHYSDAELRLLEAHDWVRSPLPTALDPLTVSHWTSLHNLVLSSWSTMLLGALVVYMQRRHGYRAL